MYDIKVIMESFSNIENAIQSFSNLTISPNFLWSHKQKYPSHFSEISFWFLLCPWNSSSCLCGIFISWLFLLKSIVSPYSSEGEGGTIHSRRSWFETNRNFGIKRLAPAGGVMPRLPPKLKIESETDIMSGSEVTLFLSVCPAPHSSSMLIISLLP